MFFVIVVIIVFGVVVEWIKFNEFLIFSVLLVGIVYFIIGYWVWDVGGWFYIMGFMDFVGFIVVYFVGGWVVLVGVFFFGFCLGKFVDG